MRTTLVHKKKKKSKCVQLLYTKRKINQNVYRIFEIDVVHKMKKKSDCVQMGFDSLKDKLLLLQQHSYVAIEE